MHPVRNITNLDHLAYALSIVACAAHEKGQSLPHGPSSRQSDKEISREESLIVSAGDVDEPAAKGFGRITVVEEHCGGVGTEVGLDERGGHVHRFRD